MRKIIIWKEDKSFALMGNKDIMGSLCLGSFLLAVVAVNSRLSTLPRLTTGGFAPRCLELPGSASCAS